MAWTFLEDSEVIDIQNYKTIVTLSEIESFDWVETEEDGVLRYDYMDGMYSITFFQYTTTEAIEERTADILCEHTGTLASVSVTLRRGNQLTESSMDAVLKFVTCILEILEDAIQKNNNCLI